VTVSFSDEDAAAEHGDAVRLLGYTVVGAVAGPTGQAAAGSDPPTADFLVSQALLEAHPAWWRALAGQASRTYSLLLGPVRMAVAEILDLHRPAPARRAGARPRPVQRQPPPRG